MTKVREYCVSFCSGSRIKHNIFDYDMEEDGDVIVIELGRVLTEEQYQEVVDSVRAFMDMRWPHFSASEFSN